MMPRTISLIAVSFLLSSIATAQLNIIDLDDRVTLISSEVDVISLSFDLSNVDPSQVEENGDMYDSHLIVAEGMTYEYNRPILPMVSRFVVVSPDAGIDLVVHSDEPRRAPAGHSPALCLDEGLPESKLANCYELRPDDGIYPPQVALMSEPFVIRGVRMVKVTTYPVQYDPATDEFIYNEHIETEIITTDEPGINPVYQPIRRNRSREFLKFIRNFAINGDIVGRDDPDEGERPYVGHYLIVTNHNCLEFAGPFIEWRRKAGYKVDIYDVGNNNRNIDAIKTGIQSRYDDYLDDGIDPFDYILLIGDRTTYQYSRPQADWILQSPVGNSVWGGAPHADYEYACLEGGNNDRHPDVAIAMWPNGSAGLMGSVVRRTLMYEATPDMDDPSWFTRGGNYAQHWGNQAGTAWHITIHSNARWGEEVLQSLGFDDVKFYEDFSHDRNGDRIGPEVRDWYNEGLNVLIGRAELYNWRSDFVGVRANTMFPIDICLSGHGEWAAEAMFRAGSGNSLIGPVARTNGWGWTCTAPSNYTWMEMVNSHLMDDMPFGWAYVYAINKIEQYFDNFMWYRNQQLYLHIKTDVDAFGDPGVQYWQGVPRIVEADHPDWITSDTRLIEVYVYDPDEETDVPGASVTLYAPGDIPDFDHNDYDTYDEMQMWTTTTDSHGVARFIFDDGVEFEARTTVYTTVTGRNIRPYFGEMEVSTPNVAIDLMEYELTEEDGNDDGDINPGETFTIALTAANIGRRNEATDVTAVVTSLSPYVVVEENEISFGDIEDGDHSEGNEEITIHINPSCPDGESRPMTQPILQVDFASDDDRWRSAIKLNPVAPNFKVRSVVGGIIIPTDEDEVELDIEIENVGGMDAPAVTAEVRSSGLGLSLIDETANYPPIDAGRHSRIDGDPFLITGNRIVVPGSRTEVMLILRTVDDFVDTAYFDLQISETRANAPQGPDGYGYICFDDTDEEWAMAPRYQWFEISLDDRNRDEDGIRCDDLDGNSPHDMGKTQLVDLNFTTQFYGQNYDQITISSNGFVAMGDQPRMSNYQNWPLDQAIGGGVGMIAPF
ncbi:MAG: C25 family cysteine peptidase, partial [Candidatus Electryoneaceae bacterium]|nr:C25 family cysteine peptidase [Candidatus Electryoneaceae bacterium]